MLSYLTFVPSLFFYFSVPFILNIKSYHGVSRLFLTPLASGDVEMLEESYQRWMFGSNLSME